MLIGSASFEDDMQDVVRGFEVAGVGVLVVGSVLAFVQFAIEVFGRPFEEAYEGVRQGVGRAILLGLEVLIIADIILTVAIDQTLANAATLGLIVLVRTFLSFSLELEITGRWPWQSQRGGSSASSVTG